MSYIKDALLDRIVRVRIKEVRFSENLACFVFLKHPFRDSPFCPIIDDLFYCSNLVVNGCFLICNPRKYHT